MPDLNSVPRSPHSLRRQTSQQMASSPPSLSILPSNQAAMAHSRSASVSSPPLHQGAAGDGAVDAGPGPMRHPRPMTASELHMQLEKEQEAVVNRLTRELSLLRAAHNASVASNASSAASTTHDAQPADSGPLPPHAARRHHRNSSSASQNAHVSFSTPYWLAARPPQPVSLSRQNSTASSRRSQTSSPVPAAAAASTDPSSYFHQQRVPYSSSSVAATPGSASGTDSHHLSPGLMPATSRYEEAIFHRRELEAAKMENENLKKRVRELCLQLQR
ncbi:hypothetical protein CDD81_7003 [Ophiocordyceps australis]|uniref:Uncharacterized protein n=1 Tax=Ophiocordyceps australis TaxID=1399860 RepID=A0A2C5XLP5_9HYPO|nr:hypothetical protein CDD81_7003 [Ophiocordyceps australis]